MRCFLIGTKNLSVKILEELINQKHSILGVFSEDHKEEMKIWHDQLDHHSLKEKAKEHNIPVYEKTSLNSPEMIKILTEMNLDIIFCAQGSQMLKEDILNISKLGCFNLHMAYLPKNRGCFPNAWAIIKGENFGGLTIHKMLPGVDNGPIVSQIKVTIEENETGISMYEKVTNAGLNLFKETLPKFNDLSFNLISQESNLVSYNPCKNISKRGYPYGGQINPYWNSIKKTKLKNALHFPPFAGHSPEPSNFLGEHTKPNVRVMLGFDCDRPRNSLIVSEKGLEMAEKKINSIELISKDLEKLKVPRTFFICGHFLESMNYKYGSEKLQNSFCVQSELVEIADHTYSHNVVKKIESRPDKIPLTPNQLKVEYENNSSIFEEILKINVPKRGFRTPLGHYRGLNGEFSLLDKMIDAGMTYISSDLRGPDDSLFADLKYSDGTLRQPYRYENGLLEIPSIGWQDTVFAQPEYISKFHKLPDDVPSSYEEILEYYEKLIQDAYEIALKNDRDFFLPLCLHPYDTSFYNKDERFFSDLYSIVKNFQATFCTYDDVREHYDKTLETN